MDMLRVGTSNMNGGRDRNKRALLAELSRVKNIDVLLLQETHSSASGGWALGHGTNLSAGVAVSSVKRCFSRWSRTGQDSNGTQSEIYLLSSGAGSGSGCVVEILDGLPQLGEAQSASLESTISFNEMSEAVQQLSCDWSSGIDRLPLEFYKRFWTLLGKDLYEVFKDCLISGTLLLSSTRAFWCCCQKRRSQPPKKLETGVIVVHRLQNNR